MKPILFVMAIIIIAASVHAADVGVSVTVGQPGFYGRIDIGNFPHPQVIYPKPIVVQPPPNRASDKPLYLYVPPGHEKKWRKHCSKYSACGKPVYFVRESWYKQVYVPQYQERRGKPDKGRDEGPGHGEGHDKGSGHGKGHGHGKN